MDENGALQTLQSLRSQVNSGVTTEARSKLDTGLMLLMALCLDRAVPITAVDTFGTPAAHAINQPSFFGKNPQKEFSEWIQPLLERAMPNLTTTPNIKRHLHVGSVLRRLGNVLVTPDEEELGRYLPYHDELTRWEAPRENWENPSLACRYLSAIWTSWLDSAHFKVVKPLPRRKKAIQERFESLFHIYKDMDYGNLYTCGAPSHEVAMAQALSFKELCQFQFQKQTGGATKKRAVNPDDFKLSATGEALKCKCPLPSVVSGATQHSRTSSQVCLFRHISSGKRGDLIHPLFKDVERM